jgi:hypothetical protein
MLDGWAPRYKGTDGSDYFGCDDVPDAGPAPPETPPFAVKSASGVNPKQAFGDRKAKLQIVPASATIAIANGLAEGAEKYGAWNWRDQPVQRMTYVGSTLRHLAAFVEGEDIDPDGKGKTHLEGAIASLAILIDSIACGTSFDDRPGVKSEGTLKMLSKGNAKQDK